MFRGRNFGLDVIRAIAILSVLSGHFIYYILSSFTEPHWLSPYLGGFGVELFFVLSGFLVGRIMLRTFETTFGWRHVVNFYYRRWLRTYPVYVLFFVVQVYLTVSPGSSLAGLFQNLTSHIEYLVFLQNLAWPMIGSWYPVTWSLAVEEWFYLVFPLAFTGLAALNIKNRVLWTALASIMICLVLRAYAHAPEVNVDEQIRKVVIYRLDSISFGVLCAVLADRYSAFLERYKTLLFTVGLVGLIGIIASSFYADIIGSLFFATFYWSLIPLCLVLVLPLAQFANWHKMNAHGSGWAITWLSHHAYILYLSHMPVIAAMRTHGLITSPLVAVGIYAGANALIAVVVRQLIEKPFMDLRPAELPASVPLIELSTSKAARL
jgi:peptidoglycan/LPS O-acetylase OafA/YrhL